MRTLRNSQYRHRPNDYRRTALCREKVEQIGLNSLALICAAGLSLGLITALHTRTTMVNFGAEAWIPTLQSASFFNEIGPLVTGLLIAGRVGAGIGAELANMRATEQIDAIEAMSIDAFRFLVVTRIVACIYDAARNRYLADALSDARKREGILGVAVLLPRPDLRVRLHPEVSSTPDYHWSQREYKRPLAEDCRRLVTAD